MRQHISTIDELVQILKQTRRSKGITQLDLADFSGLSNHGISKIELGSSDPRLSTLLRLTELLGLRIIIESDE